MSVRAGLSEPATGATLELYVGGAACCLQVVLGWDRAGLSSAQFSATEDLGVGQGELSNDFLD